MYNQFKHSFNYLEKRIWRNIETIPSKHPCILTHSSEHARGLKSFVNVFTEIYHGPHCFRHSDEQQRKSPPFSLSSCWVKHVISDSGKGYEENDRDWPWMTWWGIGIFRQAAWEGLFGESAMTKFPASEEKCQTRGRASIKFLNECDTIWRYQWGQCGWNEVNKEEGVMGGSGTWGLRRRWRRTTWVSKAMVMS